MSYAEKLIVTVVVFSILWALSERGKIDDIRPALRGTPKFDGLVDGLVSPTIDEQLGGKPVVNDKPYGEPWSIYGVNNKRRLTQREIIERDAKRERHRQWLEEFYGKKGGGP